MAASTKWIGGMITGLGTFSARFVAWFGRFLVSPSAAMGTLWARLGSTWAVRLTTSLYTGASTALTTIGGAFVSIATAMKTFILDVMGILGKSLVDLIFNSTGTIATFSQVWGVFSASMVASGGWIIVIILLVLATIAAVSWGFYTNFQGMTDNFWLFADSLYNLWTDVILPVLKAFWGALQILGGFMWLVIVNFWEYILKPVFEDLAAAFNNIILVVTWLINVFVDLWNFVSPVLIPILVVLAIVFGGVLFLKIMAVITIVVLLFRVFTLVVRLIAYFIYICMEAIKWLGDLAAQLWEATHEGESFAESWYNSSLILGESGGIFGRITDMVVVLGGALKWLGTWFDYIAATATNKFTQIEATIANNLTKIAASARYMYGGKDAGLTAAETRDKAYADADQTYRSTVFLNQIPVPDVQFFEPFFESLALAGVTAAATAATALAVAALPATGGLSGLAIAGIPAATLLMGTYFTAQPLSRAVYKSMEGSDQLLKAEMHTNAVEWYKDYVSNTVGIGSLFGDRGLNNPYKGKAVDQPSDDFLSKFGAVLGLGLDSSLAAADRAESTGKEEQAKRMLETEKKYKEELKGKTPSEIAALEKQYQAYLTEEAKVTAGFKKGVFSAAPIAPVDPFADKKFTPQYGPVANPKPRVVAPPQTRDQYMQESNRAEAGLATRLTNIQNTIYTTSASLIASRTLAAGGAAAAPTQTWSTG